MILRLIFCIDVFLFDNYVPFNNHNHPLSLSFSHTFILVCALFHPPLPLLLLVFFASLRTDRHAFTCLTSIESECWEFVILSGFSLIFSISNDQQILCLIQNESLLIFGFFRFIELMLSNGFGKPNVSYRDNGMYTSIGFIDV